MKRATLTLERSEVGNSWLFRVDGRPVLEWDGDGVSADSVRVIERCETSRPVSRCLALVIEEFGRDAIMLMYEAWLESRKYCQAGHTEHGGGE